MKKTKLIPVVTLVILFMFIQSTSSSFLPPNRIREQYYLEQHYRFMQNVNVFYPWKNLTKSCVFFGQFSSYYDGRETESVWLCIWNDSKNLDVACIITLIIRMEGFVLAVSREDAGAAALELCVEVNGTRYYPFKQAPNSDNIGFTMIVLDK